MIGTRGAEGALRERMGVRRERVGGAANRRREEARADCDRRREECEGRVTVLRRECEEGCRGVMRGVERREDVERKRERRSFGKRERKGDEE
jgi:hypothetical protein